MLWSDAAHSSRGWPPAPDDVQTRAGTAGSWAADRVLRVVPLPVSHSCTFAFVRLTATAGKACERAVSAADTTAGAVSAAERARRKASVSHTRTVLSRAVEARMPAPGAGGRVHRAVTASVWPVSRPLHCWASMSQMSIVDPVPAAASRFAPSTCTAARAMTGSPVPARAAFGPALTSTSMMEPSLCPQAIRPGTVVFVSDLTGDPMGYSCSNSWLAMSHT